MEYNTLFFIIVGIVIFGFLLERFLAYLNARNLSNIIPKEVEGIYDAEKYKKLLDYEKVNYKFSAITSTFSLLLILFMLFSGGFAIIDNFLRQYTSNPILLALLFFGVIFLASDLLNTPFDIYDTFVIEERFGFNKTTWRTYILDKIKGWLLAAVFGGLILSAIIWFYYKTIDMFWIYGWIVVSLFSVIITMFYSNLIVPIFNKQKPLEDGDLKDEINKFCNKLNFKLDNVYVIDGSKRSTKANAYFSGLGPKKRIVLFDTLVNEFSTSEIVAVLAHEIGHYKKKHTLMMTIVSVIQTGLIFYILSLLLSNPHLSEALMSDKPSFHIGLIAFGILYSPVSLIISLVINIFSRKNEYEADKFAAQYYDGSALSTALKKLSIKNLSNLLPHPAYVFFYYSHPPLLKRLEALQQVKYIGE
jgi:STE24 endopeptidase